MAVAEGIHRLEVPTLLPVGTVNVYLVAGDPLTLIDTGPRSEDTLEALQARLREVGYGLKELDWILLTHGHMDHYGLAREIAEASGAEVFVHAADRTLVEDFHSEFRHRRDYYEDQLRSNGVPGPTLAMMEEFFEFLTTLGDETPVAGTFGEGDVLDLGPVKLQVLHTPGHSSGACCFLAGDGTLFSGDTLLEDITANAVFGSEEGTTAGLRQQLESLRRLSRKEVAQVCPGHGEPFTDVAGVVGRAMAQYEERKELLLRHLAEEPATAFDLVVRLFGTLPLEQVFLGVCEVLGHMEILQDEGLVTASEKEGRLLFERAR